VPRWGQDPSVLSHVGTVYYFAAYFWLVKRGGGGLRESYRTFYQIKTSTPVRPSWGVSPNRGYLSRLLCFLLNNWCEYSVASCCHFLSRTRMEDQVTCMAVQSSPLFSFGTDYSWLESDFYIYAVYAEFLLILTVMAVDSSYTAVC
jgi:hypothetical protein